MKKGQQNLVILNSFCESCQFPVGGIPQSTGNARRSDEKENRTAQNS
jgi:hypothetical protein